MSKMQGRLKEYIDNHRSVKSKGMDKLILGVYGLIVVLMYAWVGLGYLIDINLGFTLLIASLVIDALITLFIYLVNKSWGNYVDLSTVRLSKVKEINLNLSDLVIEDKNNPIIIQDSGKYDDLETLLQNLGLNYKHLEVSYKNVTKEVAGAYKIEVKVVKNPLLKNLKGYATGTAKVNITKL